MNKKVFRGWRDVFSFTFMQGVKQKNFKQATLGIVIFLFVASMAISVIMALSQKKDIADCFKLEVVHVVDESGLQMLYWDGFIETNKERYPNVSFEAVEGTVEEISRKLAEQVSRGNGTKGAGDVILHIVEAEDGYRMTLYIPEYSVIKEEVGKDFLERVTMAMEQSKLLSSKISMEKLVFAMSGISASIKDAGEVGRSLGENLVIALLPIFCEFFLIMIILIYGQSIGNTVSVEKTSKLMELMLTMTSPTGLIFGKILATTCIAITQILCCAGGLMLGFLLGHVVAGNLIYPQYNNVLMVILQSLKEQEVSNAFSIDGLLLAFLTLCLSVLFCFLLAGLIASFVTKPEDLTRLMEYYNLIVLIGAQGLLLNYPHIAEGREWLITILRIIPITGAFMLPGDMVVGNITVGESILYIAILLASTIILAVITGKVYKKQLFYQGTGLKERFKNCKSIKQ